MKPHKKFASSVIIYQLPMVKPHNLFISQLSQEYMTETPSCVLCGEQKISKFWTGFSTQNSAPPVCGWACASLLNIKLLRFLLIISVIFVLLSVVINPYFLLMPLPICIFATASTFKAVNKMKLLQYRSVND